MLPIEYSGALHQASSRALRKLDFWHTRVVDKFMDDIIQEVIHGFMQELQPVP